MQSDERPEQGRLACSICPDDGDALSLPEMEANTEQRLEVVVEGIQIFHLQQRHHPSPSASGSTPR